MSSAAAHDTPGAPGFRGRPFAVRRVPGFLLTDLRHAEGSRGAPHEHGGAYLSYLVAGSYREADGGRIIEYAPHAIRYHPPGFLHADEVGSTGARFLCVEVGEDVLAALPSRCRREPSFAGPSTALSRIGGEVTAELAHDDAGAGMVLEGLALQLVGALARLPVEESPPRWLERVAERLRAELHLRLELGELAREAGVHPVHLARAFRRHFGRSVGEELRRLRVDAARTLLESPEASLADVACATGFADQSHLSRVFRRATGRSPGEYRSGAAKRRRAGSGAR